MKIKQHLYLSPEAVQLRQRDGIPPWGVHPCELDSLDSPASSGAFYASWREATELRAALEGKTNQRNGGRLSATPGTAAARPKA